MELSQQKEEVQFKEQPFIEHLLELRSCLIRIFIIWVIFAIFVYIFSKKIIYLLTLPLYKILPSADRQIFFRTFPEVFTTYLKLSIIGGFIAGSPLIFYEFWKFIAPGLYPHEKRILKLTVFLGCSAFLIGDIFAYFIFLPAIFKFFYSFGSEFLVFKPFLKEYINFVLKLFIFFGVLFQMPAVMVLLEKAGIVSYESFKKLRPYIIVLIFFISAVVTTSPDPLNQLLIAIPLTILYEIGIILIRITNPKKLVSKGG